MRLVRALAERSESSTREVARGGVINAASAGSGALATFGLLLVVARGTTVDTAGLFFQALALASAGSLVSTFGASSGITRAVARIPRGEGRDASAEIWSALLPLTLVGTAFAVVGTAAAGPIAGVLTDPAHQHDLTRILATMMLSVPLMAFTRFFSAVARAVDDPLVGGIYDLAGQPILRMAVAVVAVVGGWTLGGLGLAITLPAGVCAIGALVQTRRALARADIRCSLRPVWHPATAAGFWHFAAPRGLEEIVQAANIWLLILLVGALTTPGQAAAYAAITRWTMGTTLILQSVTTATLPRLSAAFHRGDLAGANALFRVTTHWIVVVSTPICLSLLLFPGTLMSIVAPDLPDATIGLRILAIGSIVNVVTGPVGGVILMAGRSTINLMAALVAVLALVVPAIPLITAHGASGAAVAWALSLATQNLLLLWYGWRHLGLSPWSRLTLRTTGVAAACAALPMVVAAVVAGDTVGSWLVSGVAGGAVALLALSRAPSPQPAT